MEDTQQQSFVAVQYKLALKDKKVKKTDTTATTDTTAGDSTTTNMDAATAANQALAATPPALQQYVNFQNPTWDTFLFAFFLIGAFLYGLSLGRDRIIVILLSIYMSLAMVQALPAFVLHITLNQNFAFQLTAFITVFIVLFFFLSRSALTNIFGNRARRGGILEVVVFSVLHTGLLISIALSFFPADMLAKFSATTISIFTGDWPRFLWIAAPVVAMIVLTKREEED